MRVLPFDGCFNFRDLGGWTTADGRTVRWRRLFRADSVHLMSEADVRRAREDLDIRTLMDLRNDQEIEFGGVGTLTELVIARHHVPISRLRGLSETEIAEVRAAAEADRSPATMTTMYLGMLDRSSDLIVGAVEALAATDALPALFFCAAGKDRTGVLAAVVLGALGVRDSDIVDDYVLSEHAIERIIDRLAKLTDADIYADNPASNFAPHRESMEGVIAGVNESYGSFANYLVGRGLDRRTLDKLADALLE